MLGHEDIKTTQLYTQVAIRALQQIHAAAYPGAMLPGIDCRERRTVSIRMRELIDELALGSPSLRLTVDPPPGLQVG